MVQNISVNPHKPAGIILLIGLARYYKKSPDLLTPEQIQRYLIYLLEERKLAWSSCNVVLC
ncbi:phage integrase N-terminal SAM-like domain-containing protein, partial [bacterium]|nr:phage integrase N-terminal SAM-like domain-containing protein [bacterium]